MEHPDEIYLQVEDCEDDSSDATWCRDRINDSDVKYVHVDIVAAYENFFNAVASMFTEKNLIALETWIQNITMYQDKLPGKWYSEVENG